MVDNNKAGISSLDNRSTRSRRLLLDAGFELLAINPAASLSEIAAKAGVGRATLYRHFETREQLVLELARESAKMTEEALAPMRESSGTTKEYLDKSIRVIVPMADRFHFLWTLCPSTDEDEILNKIYMHQMQRLLDLVEKGKEEGFIKPELSSKWIASLIDSLIFTGWNLISEQNMTVDEVIYNIMSTLYSGIENQALK